MQEVDVPLDILHWLLALSPVVVLLVLLAVLRWKAPQAGPVGLFVAAVVALAAFQTPWDTLAVGAGKGVWDAVFILLVIWPALLLFRVTDRAGAFDALRRGISRFSENDMFLVLAFGWVFASFLQGIAGFGTPIAVVAPLMLAIGVRPVMAVVIPLIGHAWANMFGTLAVGWLATLQVVDLENETRTAFETAIQLWIPNLGAGLFIAWLVGRGKGVAHALPLVLIMSAVHGGGQLLLTLWNPILSNFLPAAAGVAVLYPLSRWARYREAWNGEVLVMRGEGEDEPEAEEEAEEAEREKESAEPPMGLVMAFLPYLILTVASVVVLVIPPVEEAFEAVEIGLPFPEVDTGYEVTQEREEPYSPFTPFTHPGFFLLIASMATYFVYRSKGFYREWSREADTSEPVWRGVVKDATPASVAVVSFLVLSKIMDHSGQTDTLALGLAEVAPPMVFAFFSTWIGVLGAFMTSSNTASNVLFASLQQTVAETEGLAESSIIAAQSTGGAIGNAIAPANIVLGTGTAGIVGQEGQVLRRTLPWSVAMAVLVGIATVIMTGVA